MLLKWKGCLFSHHQDLNWPLGPFLVTRFMVTYGSTCSASKWLISSEPSCSLGRGSDLKKKLSSVFRCLCSFVSVAEGGDRGFHLTDVVYENASLQCLNIDKSGKYQGRSSLRYTTWEKYEPLQASFPTFLLYVTNLIRTE